MLLELRFIRNGRQHIVHTHFFVTPLRAVAVEERCGVHLARRTTPVQTKGQGQPTRLWAQFFLSHIVGPTTTALTNTAAHNQHIDQSAVVHIHVVPVVHCRTYNHHGLTTGLIGIISKFSGNLNNLSAWNTGDFFLPSRRVSNGVIIKTWCNMFTTQTAVNTVVGHHQVVNSSNFRLWPICQRNGTRWHITHLNAFTFLLFPMITASGSKIREGNGIDITAIDQGQLQFHFIAIFALTGFDIPFTFAITLLTPAIADGALWRNQFATQLVKSNSFPIGVVFLPQIVGQVRCA